MRPCLERNWWSLDVLWTNEDHSSQTWTNLHSNISLRQLKELLQFWWTPSTAFRSKTHKKLDETWEQRWRQGSTIHHSLPLPTVVMNPPNAERQANCRFCWCATIRTSTKDAIWNDVAQMDSAGEDIAYSGKRHLQHQTRSWQQWIREQYCRRQHVWSRVGGHYGHVETSHLGANVGDLLSCLIGRHRIAVFWSDINSHSEGLESLLWVKGVSKACVFSC